MSAAAKKIVKSDARANSIASFVAAMGAPRKVSPKKQAVVLDDDGAVVTSFAAFAEREKKKIMDLGIEDDESFLNTEINRLWEMSGRGKSVALKAKAASKGSATPTSKADKVEKEDVWYVDEPPEVSMHIMDSKLDAAIAKTMGVEFAGEIKGKFLYKNVEVKEAKQPIKKVKEPTAELAKLSASAAKPKPSPKAKPPPKAKPSPSSSKAVSSGGSSKKRKSDDAAAKSGKKKAKVEDEEAVDYDDRDQSAEHWTQVAAGRLMVKCKQQPEARVHLQGLLNVFGVELPAKVLSSKTVTFNEVSELARQMHYETDNGEDDEEEEAPHEDAIGKDDSEEDEEDKEDEDDDEEE